MFLHGGTAISWKSLKQTLVAIFTNHSEIIALYEASRECAWLRRVIDHIQTSCGMSIVESTTIIYEDNAACVAQMQAGYIRTNYTKHISLKFFYSHQLQGSREISISQIKSFDNHAYLFTKLLPLAIFDKCVKGIGMRRLKDLHGSRGEPL
jgi:virulence-associated protein VapD